MSFMPCILNTHTTSRTHVTYIILKIHKRNMNWICGIPKKKDGAHRNIKRVFRQIVSIGRAWFLATSNDFTSDEYVNELENRAGLWAKFEQYAKCTFLALATHDLCEMALVERDENLSNNLTLMKRLIVHSRTNHSLDMRVASVYCSSYIRDRLRQDSKINTNLNLLLC